MGSRGRWGWAGEVGEVHYTPHGVFQLYFGGKSSMFQMVAECIF